jgi:nucleotide-binding universal stress UspA family protein
MGFSNILLLTFSHAHTPQALRQVIELARRDNGCVTAMAVIPPAPKLQRLFTPHETSDHVEQVLRDELVHDLSDWVARASGHRQNDDVTVRVDQGHVVATVLHQVAEEDHDLLAVTSDPTDPAARAIIKRLQRKSSCPVWAIRPDRSRKRRVLAAVDTDPDHHGLDHRILHAARWLVNPGDELHIVTAWELLGESTLRSSPFLGSEPSAVDELRARCEAEHRELLQHLVGGEDFPTDDVHLHVHNGPAGEAIVDLVVKHRINQLVMGTIGRTGLPGFVIGNTAELLLTEVSCSILVVKPPGFVSAFHA